MAIRQRALDRCLRPGLHRRPPRAARPSLSGPGPVSLASSFILEAGGFDSPLVRPSGLDYPAHCAASETSLVRAPMLEPHPRPCTAPALTACCLPSRLAGCSSSPPRTTTILGSLGISGAACTTLPVHIWRADASVGTESARRVDFARVDGRVRGSGWDPYGLRVPM